MFSDLDHRMMAKALKLAKKARYHSHPNPSVGCVFSKGEQIIAQGWTQPAGKAHAEIHAISQTQDNLAGTTAYVTLEPCSHYGRTPPCAKALIEVGILRLVAAAEDPNIKVAGAGLEQLKEAGIKVETGLFESQAREINKGFFSLHERGRPWVRLKTAASLDGKTAMASGESQWITSSYSRQDGHRFRSQAGAILTGINTVLTDDPSLTVRLPGTDKGQIRQPLLVILDSKLKTPLKAKILDQSAQVLILTCSDADGAAALRLKEKGANIVQLTANNGRLDLTQVLKTLAAMEINQLHVEAGQTLTGQWLEQGLADELIIYLAPKILGDSGQGMFGLPTIDALNQALEVKIIDQRMVGDDLRLRINLTSGS